MLMTTGASLSTSLSRRLFLREMAGDRVVEIDHIFKTENLPE